MAFIKVTPTNVDKQPTINTEQISTLWPAEGSTRLIMADGTTLYVEETVDQIVKAANKEKPAKAKVEA